MKLLVIDDDEISLCQVTATSSCIGLTVYQAVDAEQGIKILETINEPMIVIVDIMMPGNDGFTFCQLARNVSLEHSPYIIAYSSLSEKEVLIPILESGADDFVQKGNCKNIFLARINVAIRNIENRKEQSQRLALLDNEITRAQNHHLLNIQLMNLIAFHFKFTASQCDTQNSAKELLHWTDYMFMIGEGLHREREFMVDELINCMSDYFGKSIFSIRFNTFQAKSEQKKMLANYNILTLLTKSMIRFVITQEYLQNFSFKIGQRLDGDFHFIECNLVSEITDFVLAQPNVEAFDFSDKELRCIGQICELMGGYFGIQKRNMFIIYRLGLPVKVEVSESSLKQSI
jgi:DNA-binding response OmpR family regulator